MEGNDGMTRDRSEHKGCMGYMGRNRIPPDRCTVHHSESDVFDMLSQTDGTWIPESVLP